MIKRSHYPLLSQPLSNIQHCHFNHGCVHAESLQLCRTLWDPMDFSPSAPLSMGFSRQEYWSGLPCPPPGDLPDPGIKPTSPASPELAGRFFTTEPPGKSICLVTTLQLEGPELQGRNKGSLPAPQFLHL